MQLIANNILKLQLDGKDYIECWRIPSSKDRILYIKSSNVFGVIMPSATTPQASRAALKPFFNERSEMKKYS